MSSARSSARDSIDRRAGPHAQEALDACLSFQPHLLVLDIGLPDGDGFNVVDWLRQHESSGPPAAGGLLRPRSLAGRRRQLTLGPTHFLTKARVQPQQLEALVLTMLRSSRHQEENAPPASSLQSP
jgi:DNA-binding response OmpR family regulator